MQKTKKIFNYDPYQSEFTANVVKIDGDKVWLDQTVFYPESGGQAGDTGYINDYLVIDTQYDGDKNIFHQLDQKPDLLLGQSVKGKIDWDRRYKIMRVHAASHIMEHFLFQVFGDLKLLGSHLNEKHDKSTYEYDGQLDQVRLLEVERLSNELIDQDLEILRCLDEKRPDFRYWQCDKIKMPCGGTHPKRTLEIGHIKLKRKTGGEGRESVITSLIS